MPVLKRTYIILSGSILTTVILLVVICIRYNQAFKKTSVSVLHTISVLNESRSAGGGLREYEKGHGTADLYLHFRNLRKQTLDDPSQQRRVDSLFAYAARMGPDPLSIKLFRGQAAAYYPDTIREVLLRMMDTEHLLLADREIANQSSRRLLSTGIIGLLIFVFVLLCVLVLLIIFHFNRQRKAEARLDESERRFSQLIQSEKYHAIFLLDTEGRILSWNEGARRIKGYTESEVLGRPIMIFYTEEDIASGEPARNLMKAAEGGEYESFGWRKRKDGSLFWADVTITAFRDHHGMLTGYIKITRDISLQRMAEEQIKHSLSHEMELNEMKSRFVSLASHEFKTPLTVILSSMGLIEKYEGPEMILQRRRHVQRVKANINTMKQILSDFLSLEKLENGMVANNPCETDLVRMATEAAADLESSCKEEQRVSIEIHGAARQVKVDAHILRHVLNNLLSNAIKYSPAASLVRFILDFEADSVRFTVTDQGIGIPLEDQEHLFQRFFRAGNTAGISGTGLGLSIVKKYLDLMGGQIRLTSSSGNGTTFTVTIPAYASRHEGKREQDPIKNHPASGLR